MFHVDKDTFHIAEWEIIKKHRKSVLVSVNLVLGGTMVTRLPLDGEGYRLFDTEEEAKAFVRSAGLDRIEAISSKIAELKAEEAAVQRALGLA